jgi:hypothetical protein
VASSEPQDHDLATAYAQRLAGVRRDARRLAELLLGLGDVGEGVDVDTLTDSLRVLGGPETYLRLTRNGGWSGDRYVAWLADTMGAVIYRHPAG